MTLDEWLRTRTPPAPPALQARVVTALGASGQSGADDAPERFLGAAETLVEELLRDPGGGRAHALDLLAVDALVTYAFEAAAEQPETLARRAVEAMVRLAQCGQDARP
ncbi:MAG TPA: hypothetical protein VFW98_00070 [Gemmatimonadaceae bacterium]|nr:hypothetical protein [Gemmatimonadaceae bacterium]